MNERDLQGSAGHSVHVTGDEVWSEGQAAMHLQYEADYANQEADVDAEQGLTSVTWRPDVTL